MIKTTNDNKIQDINLDKVSKLVGTTSPEFQACEADFRSQYVTGTDEHTKMMQALSSIDKRTTLAAALETSNDASWRNYIPELFVQNVLNTTIKRPDYSAVICPNSVTVTRDPAVFVSLEQGDDKNVKPSWQFIGENEDIAKTMHSYKRKEVSLRRYGQGWTISKDLMADIPLDLLAHRQLLASATLIPFKENMLTSSLYAATSGTMETTYSNTYECDGIRTTKTVKGGMNSTRDHKISVDDILCALQEYRTGMTPESEVIGSAVKGQNYYTPSAIVLSPLAIADLSIELWRGGFSTYGTNFDARNQVQQTAMLSSLFGVPVVPLWSVKATAETPETPANWEYIYDGYIVDVDLGPVELAHGDGWFVQSWFVDSKRTFCYAQSRRSSYFVQDPKAVMRLIAA